MTPAALADRIAALDWSGVSLQHRLAVVAAVETLRKVERVPTVANAVIPCPNPAGCNAQDCQWRPGQSASVLPFPVPAPGASYAKETMTRLRRLDGTLVSAQYTTRRERWEWVVEMVVEQCGCDPSLVGLVERQGDDAGDTVTVDGLPAFFLC